MDHAGDVLGFSVTNEEVGFRESQLPNKVTFEIMIGLYSPAGGTSGEMCIRWREYGSDSVPRLECYDDGWSALAEINRRTDGRFLTELEKLDNQNSEPEIITHMLKELGFEDYTARKPDEEPLVGVRIASAADAMLEIQSGRNIIVYGVIATPDDMMRTPIRKLIADVGAGAVYTSLTKIKEE